MCFYFANIGINIQEFVVSIHYLEFELTGKGPVVSSCIADADVGAFHLIDIFLIARQLNLTWIERHISNFHTRGNGTFFDFVFYWYSQGLTSCNLDDYPRWVNLIFDTVWQAWNF